ncbi:MAG TPA: malto-oligosyltrehalose trehalohydrolase [Candidatus Angelobacter sp.]|jgi:maltooligosyltrehalose trehalohydrolase|nr:malto-oligosyltrehalose trehalohydrolase [Candidatus Angelobacter sp.]
MRFAVWAPHAERVDLAIRGRNLPMRRGEGGWFSVEDGDAAPGDRYGFRLDGAEPLPDPRSPSQPDGVHGLSEVVDHAAFAWTDQGWHGAPLSAAVIYELHTGTFTPEGSFDAVIPRLGALVDLGVTAIELMPVAEFPGARGWGYDGVDLYAPHHAYGGPAGLKRLVDAAHARGLAVILDVVYNHLGPDGNHLARFGPYFTEKYRTPWGAALNYDDAGSDEVRRFAIDNALMWLRDHHVDGLRLDAVHAILDGSAVHLLEQLAVEVEALQAELGRTLWVIAESDLNDPRLVRAREASGYGLDAQWSDDFHHALHAALTGERNGYYADFGPLSDVARALANVFVNDGRYSRFRRRRHGRPATGLPGDRFLGYLQNHDQVGNRAMGERSAALMSPGRLRIGAALVLAAPFVPLLFQGEEWAASSPFQYFTDHRDPALGRAVTEGRRREFAAFGWSAEEVPDPQDPSTFSRSRLDWSERDRPPHRDMLEWHRRLIALRREQAALSDARLERVSARADDAAGWLLLRRGPLSVLCNVSDGAVRVELGAAVPRQVLLASHEGVEVGGDGIALPPQSVVIVEDLPGATG